MLKNTNKVHQTIFSSSWSRLFLRSQNLASSWVHQKSVLIKSSLFSGRPSSFSLGFRAVLCRWTRGLVGCSGSPPLTNCDDTRGRTSGNARYKIVCWRGKPYRIEYRDGFSSIFDVLYLVAKPSSIDSSRGLEIFPFGISGHALDFMQSKKRLDTAKMVMS